MEILNDKPGSGIAMLVVSIVSVAIEVNEPRSEIVRQLIADGVATEYQQLYSSIHKICSYMLQGSEHKDRSHKSDFSSSID
jgi:hypothetical protein